MSRAATSSDVERLLIQIQQRFACPDPSCPCREFSNASLVTHCPAHDDRRPSLSATVRGGRLLVHCFSGCPQQDVVLALRARRLWTSARRARS
jgi:hypothetical protein